MNLKIKKSELYQDFLPVHLSSTFIFDLVLFIMQKRDTRYLAGRQRVISENIINV